MSRWILILVLLFLASCNDKPGPDWTFSAHGKGTVKCECVPTDQRATPPEVRYLPQPHTLVPQIPQDGVKFPPGTQMYTPPPPDPEPENERDQPRD